MKLSELETKYKKQVKVTSPHIVYNELQDIRNYHKETFVVFYLNTANHIISREIVGIGTLNTCLIHPREVFRTAIIRNANSIILAHNHPSGDTTPSDEDLKITSLISHAGEIIGIKLLDHMIVGKDNNGYCSMLENSNLKYNNE